MSNAESSSSPGRWALAITALIGGATLVGFPAFLTFSELVSPRPLDVYAVLVAPALLGGVGCMLILPGLFETPPKHEAVAVALLSGAAILGSPSVTRIGAGPEWWTYIMLALVSTMWVTALLVAWPDSWAVRTLLVIPLLVSALLVAVVASLAWLIYVSVRAFGSARFWCLVALAFGLLAALSGDWVAQQ